VQSAYNDWQERVKNRLSLGGAYFRSDPFDIFKEKYLSGSEDVDGQSWKLVRATSEVDCGSSPPTECIAGPTGPYDGKVEGANDASVENVTTNDLPKQAADENSLVASEVNKTWSFPGTGSTEKRGSHADNNSALRNEDAPNDMAIDPQYPYRERSKRKSSFCETADRSDLKRKKNEELSIDTQGAVVKSLARFPASSWPKGPKKIIAIDIPSLSVVARYGTMKQACDDINMDNSVLSKSIRQKSLIGNRLYAVAAEENELLSFMSEASSSKRM